MPSYDINLNVNGGLGGAMPAGGSGGGAGGNSGVGSGSVSFIGGRYATLVGKAMGSATAAAMGALPAIGAILTIAKILETAAGPLMRVLTAILKMLGLLVMPVVNLLIPLLLPILMVLRPLVKWMWVTMRPIFQEMMKAMKELREQGGDAGAMLPLIIAVLAAAIGGMIAGPLGIALGMFLGIVVPLLVQGLADLVVGVVGSIGKFFGDNFPKILAALVEIGTKAYESVKTLPFVQGIVSVVEGMKAFWDSTAPIREKLAAGDFSGAVQAFIDGIVGLFSGVWDGFVGWVKDVSGINLKEVWNAVLRPAFANFSWFVSVLLVAWTTYGEPAFKKFSEIVSSFGSIISRVGGFLSALDRPGNIPKGPMKYNDFIYSGGQMHEFSPDDTVIGKKDWSSGSGGGGTFNISIYGATDPVSVRRELERLIRDEFGARAGYVR